MAYTALCARCRAATYMHECKCSTEDQYGRSAMVTGHYCARPSVLYSTDGSADCGVSLFGEYLYPEGGMITILRNALTFTNRLVDIFQKTGDFTNIAVNTSELTNLSSRGQVRDR